MKANTPHYTLLTDRHHYVIVYKRGTNSVVCMLGANHIRLVIKILRKMASMSINVRKADEYWEEKQSYLELWTDRAHKSAMLKGIKRVQIPGNLSPGALFPSYLEGVR